ncbi:MAG TPA: sodium:proton antiporter [Kofleriaceae bacterium]|jgi:CPA1 family monovalent cation:H+ antiporter
MTDFQLAAIVLALAASVAYLNSRFLKLPSAVGLMATAMFGSLAIVALDASGAVDVSSRVREVVTHLDFGNTLLHGMLGLLLFAGALHIDLADLGAEKLQIASLAVGGTVLSAALVGIASYFLLDLLGVHLAWIEALLFGAVISPTDPIAVLGVLKSAGAPHELSTRMAGESLFNDGVGVVLFTVLVTVHGGGEPDAATVAALFAQEVLGGIAFGLVAGFVAVRLIRSIDDYPVEVLITLSLVVSGYASAEALGVSAPIAAVVAGLVVGNRGRRIAMSERSRVHVDIFWQLVDEILNAVLFLMMGLAVILVPMSWTHVEAGAVAIVIALAARWISVAIPLTMLRPFREATPHAITILTWGGLRGGLSIAMALALPTTANHDILLVMTYAVVACSILLQGMSFGPLLRRLTHE